MWDPEVILHLSGWRHSLVTIGLFWVGIAAMLLYQNRGDIGFKTPMAFLGIVFCLLWPVMVIALFIVVIVPRWRRNTFR
jgi:hypothetical protein